MLTTRRSLTAAVLVAAFAVAGAVSAQAPDRSHPPEAGPPPALHLPAFESRSLSNGLPVWIVGLHDVPVAQVTLLVFSGSGDDPAGQYGVASLTAAMLTEGAGSRSALEIADAVDFLGADLGSGSGIDASAVRLHTPVGRLADALPIMADVALAPSFPAAELERLRRARLTALLQARDEPASIASIAFSRVLYGTSHRYGTPTFGTAQTIAAFTPADLRAFYAARYRPSNAALLVVGDVSAAGVMPLLESSFGSWKGGPQAAPGVTLPAPPEAPRRQVFLVDKPGAAQSQIRIGSVGVPRSTPDFFAIEVMNTILGGSFSSRLNMNLREQHGYTYGAQSMFDMRASAGPFVAAAGVQTDKTADALKEFFVELNGMLQPVPQQELDRAKHYVALRFPAGFETTTAISRRLEDMLVYHLPQDYFAQYVSKIEGVTAADVERVARKYVRPDRVDVVVVGDLKRIEPSVRALNLGPVTVLTVDDVFGPPPEAGK